MYKSELKIRVRYAETDRMGYVYYGNYATYFEVARVEALRELGFSYKSLEDDGILLPVAEFSIKYLRPAFYDDELTIITEIPELPGTRIQFHYQVFNAKGELLTKASTTLVFVQKDTGRPCPAPALIIEAWKPFFAD